MGFFKKLFEKKEAKVETEQEEQVEEIVDYENVCAACELGIHDDQKSVKVAGRRYHVKPCWRNIQKMAKQQAFG